MGSLEWLKPTFLLVNTGIVIEKTYGRNCWKIRQKDLPSDIDTHYKATIVRII